MKTEQTKLVFFVATTDVVLVIGMSLHRLFQTVVGVLCVLVVLVLIRSTVVLVVRSVMFALIRSRSRMLFTLLRFGSGLLSLRYE